MDDAIPHPRPGAGARAALWLLAVAAWTAALLRPEPSAVEAATLPPDAAPFASKVLHVAAYAFLTLLSLWQLIPRPARVGLVLGLIGHALTTEYLQQFVPPRTASWVDVGFNLVGILAGLLTARLVASGSRGR